MSKKNEMYEVYVNYKFIGITHYLQNAKNMVANELDVYYNCLGYDKSIDNIVTIQRGNVKYCSWDSGRSYTKMTRSKPRKTAI